MSFVVKGMEMPTSCANCDLAKHFDGYNENDCPFNCFSYYDCLLVPVPPHGRLIDADALKETFRIGMENATPLFTSGLFLSLAESVTKALMEDIDEAPTIIEAEEGE